jgi:hypothetical protein
MSDGLFITISGDSPMMNAEGLKTNDECGMMNDE